MVSRGRATVQLSTATEHLLREKLRLLEHPDHDGWISYPALVEMLTPSHVRPREAESLKCYRKLRNAAVHDAAQIERSQLADFEGSTVEILRFLERFLRQELQIDPLDELDSCFVQMLRGETLDLHDKADLRSKLAVDFVIVEHDIEEAVELANEAFDLAVRAVACGIGLPAESGTTDDVMDLMRQQGQNNEAYYIVHDEYKDLKPGHFQEHYASFSDLSKVEEHVKLVREVVIDLLNRAHRPRWEARVRGSWPHVLALVAAKSPETPKMISEDPEDVKVTGTHVWLGYYTSTSGRELHEQAVRAALQRAVPELPREFTVAFSGLFTACTGPSRRAVQDGED
jgi:hypothetical protein